MGLRRVACPAAVKDEVTMPKTLKTFASLQAGRAVAVDALLGIKL